ncbi:MAG TPA: hypothetical protein PKM50_09645 [Methanoregula sp.]|nr:hypothetical protein [Methanoregula sp.]
MTGTTLADYGVVNIDFLIPEAYLPPNEIIKETLDWQELNEFLKLNREHHPNDRLWITNNPHTGKHQVRREK